MPESDAPEDMWEYLSRLGTVLQIARREFAKVNQVDAAAWMKMSTAAFTRWEQGKNKISAYDVARLIRLYEANAKRSFDANLLIDPPSSKVEIRRRLGVVSSAATAAARRAVLRPLEPPADGEPE